MGRRAIKNNKRIVAVGSTNPVKIKAVHSAFKKCWPDTEWEVKGVEVASDVSHQPMTDSESVHGARNRAKRALKKVPHAEFGVGLESGLQKVGKEWFSCGWIVVIDRQKREGIGSTARIHAPSKMMDLIHQGHELGTANDILTGRKNTKHSEGHMGIMTKGVITREHAYTDGVVMALVRFLSPEFYE